MTEVELCEGCDLPEIHVDDLISCDGCGGLLCEGCWDGGGDDLCAPCLTDAWGEARRAVPAE